MKTPGFYDNAHLHIYPICLRFDVLSLTETQYLHIDSSGKGTHTNESMMLLSMMFYLYGFVRWIKCILAKDVMVKKFHNTTNCVKSV